MPQPFDGVIIQIRVNHLDGVWVKTFGIDAESVILRGDANSMIGRILDGMVGAVMAEFHFIRFPAERETDDLIS